MPIRWFLLLSLVTMVGGMTWILTLYFSLAIGLCWLIAALMIWLGHHLFHLTRLLDWLNQERGCALPVGRGLWDDVFAALYRRTRQREAERERLEIDLARFETIGNALPEGMIVLDSDDRIEWMNPRAAQHFGLDALRDQGLPLRDLLRDPDFLRYLSAHAWQDAYVMRGVRGSDLVLEVQCIELGERRLLLSRDMSVSERIERIRRDFVANVSHELRTPITVLLGYLEWFSEPSSTEKSVPLQQQALESMLSQVRKMSSLIDDLLMLASLDGAMGFARAIPMDIAPLLNDVHADAVRLSDGKHDIVLDISGPPLLLGVEREIHSAFQNLVTNAIRYTPNGGTIAIRWLACEEGALFSVTDSGIGIAAEHLPRLTERFYRVDPGRSRATGGTGLGLAIVKHVLLQHQARLDVRSQPLLGSTFSAIFPSSRIA